MKVGLSLAAAGLLVLGLSYARAWAEADRELAWGDAAERRGDLEGARLHWRRAARWHAPLGPCGEALGRLVRLARAREEAGDRAGARESWRALRGAIASADGIFGAGHGDVRVQASDALAALGVAADPGPRHRPRSLPAVAAWLGLVLFVRGLLRLARDGPGARGRWRPEAQRWGGALTLLGLGLLLAGLLGA